MMHAERTCLVYLLLQDTDPEDQTCLDDFQECIEEYQECLEVVQICMYEDNNSDNNGQICLKPNTVQDTTETNLVLLDNQNNKISVCESGQIYLNVRNNDSSTQSDKVPSSYYTQTDEKDGYETCIDESLSEDVCAKITPSVSNNKTLQNIESINLKTDDIVQTDDVPINILFNHDFSMKRNNVLDYAVSEPCLVFSKDNHIFLDSKQETELKSYDHHNDDSLGTDEFFLIQYPPDQVTIKYRSEPAVLDQFNSQCLVQKSYIRRLEEYYNDYENCMENYKICGMAKETSDDDIFIDVVVPIRSSSAPDILDSSFVTLTYDPGPSVLRRKSAFSCGQKQPQNGQVQLILTYS